MGDLRRAGLVKRGEEFRVYFTEIGGNSVRCNKCGIVLVNYTMSEERPLGDKC